MKSADYYLTGEISLEAERDFMKFLNEQNADGSVESMNVYINSWGGGCRPGLSIADAILASKKPVNTVCMSEAMSMAFLIFVCGKHRSCFKHSTFMYHEFSQEFEQECCTSIQRGIDENARLQCCADEMILDHTHMKLEWLDEAKEKCKDWFITPAEAVYMGIVDEIIGA